MLHYGMTAYVGTCVLVHRSEIVHRRQFRNDPAIHPIAGVACTVYSISNSEAKRRLQREEKEGTCCKTYRQFNRPRAIHLPW